MSQSFFDIIKTPRKDPTRKLTRWRLGLAIAGVVFLVVALILLVIGTLRTGGWQTVEGTVVNIQEQTFKNRKSYAPVVEYLVNGEKFFHYSNFYANAISEKVGDRISIRYEPANPQNSEIQGVRVEEIVALTVGVNGLLLCAGAAFVNFLLVRAKKKRAAVESTPSPQ
jgi:hypothetical protein